MSRAWAAIVSYLSGFDPAMVRAVLLKLVRHGLTAAGALLETHGYLTNSTAEQLIAAAPFVAGMLLSIYDAYAVKTKIQNAEIAGKAEVGKTPEKDVAVQALKETTQ